MNGRGFFRISSLHVVGRSSRQTYKSYIKGGPRMEIGSEVIICYAKVSFKNGLLLALSN